MIKKHTQLHKELHRNHSLPTVRGFISINRSPFFEEEKEFDWQTLRFLGFWKSIGWINVFWRHQAGLNSKIPNRSLPPGHMRVQSPIHLHTLKYIIDVTDHGQRRFVCLLHVLLCRVVWLAGYVNDPRPLRNATETHSGTQWKHRFTIVTVVRVT